MADKTLTVSLMDPPYDSETTTTALRIVEAALDKGISVNVFAYEGAVMLPMKAQQAHPNPVKGTTVEDQQHPTTAGFISALFEKAGGDAQLQWTNCGLCIDERGAGPRQFRNALVFLAADHGRLADVRDAVRHWLAWRDA